MSRCCKFLDSPQSYHRSGNHYLVPGTFRHQLTSFRCVSVICVCCSKGCESVEGKRVLKQRGNTPNRPKGPAWLQTGIFLRLNVSESDFYARRRAFFFPPHYEGPRMVSGPHRASAVGGRVGVQGPDGCQGNICSTSWLDLIRRNAATHTGREKPERKRHSFQSLKKHASFCLSCKRKLGSRSGHTFAFHKAHRVHFVVCDSICLYFCCMTWISIFIH